MLVPDMIALGWTAMWLAMSQQKARSNAGSVVLTVCVAPWVIIGIIYATLLTLNIIVGRLRLGLRG